MLGGFAILAPTQRKNIEKGSPRRFESIVFFPMPRPEERLRLWVQGFSPKARLVQSFALGKVAAQHPLSGFSIINVVRYVSFLALHAGNGLSHLDAPLHIYPPIR